MKWTGKLHLHSETGPEGGYWALQDETSITHIPPDYGIFGGQEVWDQTNPERKGKTEHDSEILKDGLWLPLPDPMQEDPDYVRSSLFQGDRGDREADKRLMEKWGFRIIYADEAWDQKWGQGNWHYEDDHTAIAPDGTRYLSGGTPNTEPRRPYGASSGALTRLTVHWEDGQQEQRLSDSLLVERWSYDGLIILQDGDQLTIFDPHSAERLWQGEIKLKPHKLFSEDASGFWIHADQIGIDRDEWAKYFFGGYPATLMREA